MSATAVPSSPEMALILANIARAQEETAKFSAEQRKLTEEALKLNAEAANLRVIRFVTPIAAVLGAMAALIAAAPVLARWLGSGG